MKNKLVFPLVIFFFVLASCTKQNQPATQGDGYPVLETPDNKSSVLLDIDAGYPIEYEISAQQEETYYNSEINIPSPQEGLAVVYGNLRTLDEDTPYLAPSLYLGQILRPDDDPESTLIVTSVDIEDNPLAVQAVNGDFIFTAVPPGEYGLFIWTPISVFLIEDNQTEKPIILKAKEGTTLNLGTIYVP